jgi:hypothetical protein
LAIAVIYDQGILYPPELASDLPRRVEQPSEDVLQQHSWRKRHSQRAIIMLRSYRTEDEIPHSEKWESNSTVKGKKRQLRGKKEKKKGSRRS